MGKIWVKEFTGGLDTRRMLETTSGAVLIKASNGHITRGGEFEKRKAFVKRYTLPSGTVGLAATADSLYVFGHAASPVGLPSGVLYQRLIHPTNSSRVLSRILSWDLNAGKLYVVAEFENGDRFMYYNGNYVDSWADGFARGWIRIEPNEATPGKSAAGSFRITGGTVGAGNKVNSIKVGDIELLSAAVPHTGTNNTTVANIAANINAYTGTSGYTASARGWVVSLKSPRNALANDNRIVVDNVGDVTTDDVERMTGGVDPVTPTLFKLWVGKQRITDTTVYWETDAQEMATDIAAAINAYTGTSGYSAVADFRRVIVTATVAGSDPNGDNFTQKSEDGFTIEDRKALSGGSEDSLPRGTYLKTIDDKVYAVSGSVLYFSGIARPKNWTSDNVGAGFIDMASKISGSERLRSIAKYQNYIAIFGEKTVIIEYVDPDPDLNRVVQVLQNTGTPSPNSVTQFGDTDVYYLDQSGIRSLQSRELANSASTADVGVLIDSLVISQIEALTLTELRNQVIGVIEPQTKRFWMIMKDIIFVFSFFKGARVSAWSTYTPSYFDEDDDEQTFDVDTVAEFDNVLYLRSGNSIFSYGGAIGEDVQDATTAEAWLPFLDANDPARRKFWTGVDAAATGEWEIAISMDPGSDETSEDVAGITETTYNHDKITPIGESTHISPRFRSIGSGKHLLSSVVVHYQGDENEDK